MWSGFVNGFVNGWVSRVASRMVFWKRICDSLCCFCVFLKYAVRVTTGAQEVFSYTGRSVPKNARSHRVVRRSLSVSSVCLAWTRSVYRELERNCTKHEHSRSILQQAI